jgi:hypothetical protein
MTVEDAQEQKRKLNSYVYTRHGHIIYPGEMTIDQVDWRDIAFALSGMYRYNAHSRISVLRHSIGLYNLAKAKGYSLQTRLYALLHDAPEAYVMDVPVPMKRFIKPDWQHVHDLTWSLIAQKADCYPSLKEQEQVHALDKFVIEYEMDKAGENVSGVARLRYPGQTSYTSSIRADIAAAYYRARNDDELQDVFLHLIETIT